MSVSSEHEGTACSVVVPAQANSQAQYPVDGTKPKVVEGWTVGKIVSRKSICRWNFRCMKPNKVEVFLHEWNDVPVRVPQKVVLVGFPAFPVPFQVAAGYKVLTYQCILFEFCWTGYVEF